MALHAEQHPRRTELCPGSLEDFATKMCHSTLMLIKASKLSVTSPDEILPASVTANIRILFRFMIMFFVWHETNLVDLITLRVTWISGLDDQKEGRVDPEEGSLTSK